MVDAEAIKKVVQKCRLKKMYGQIVIGVEAGEIKSVDIKEHLRPEDIEKYLEAGKLIIALKKETGGEGNDKSVAET